MSALIAASVAIAVVTNALRPNGLPLPGDKTWHFGNAIAIVGYDPTTECPGTTCEEDTRVAPQQIDLPGAKSLFDAGSAHFLDARPAADYLAGHIRGAVSLPEDDFDKDARGVLGPIATEQTIVTYCSGEECMASVYVADKLADMGYANVRVFFGGWPEWVKADYPIDGTGASWSGESTWSGGGN